MCVCVCVRVCVYSLKINAVSSNIFYNLIRTIRIRHLQQIQHTGSPAQFSNVTDHKVVLQVQIEYGQADTQPDYADWEGD